MSYTPTNWSNKKAPGISDKNLNKIEQELKKLDDIVSVPDITTTTETTMPNSYDGRLLVEEIGGVCQQGANHSPTSPQEIKKSVVSGVKTHGRNYCPTYGHSGSATVWLSVRAKAKNYVAYGTTFAKVSGAVLFEVAGVKDGVTTTIRSTTYTSTVNIKNIPTSGYDEVIVACYSNNAGNELKESFVYLYDEPTTETLVYEPYVESSITFSNPIDLYGIGDVQDVIEDGKAKRRFATRRLTGYEDGFGVSSTYKGSFYFSCVDIGGKPQVPYFCTHAIYKGVEATNFVYGTCISNGESYNLWLFEEQKTVAEIQEYLANNEVYITYQLATPTTEALPIADQIALNSLATYDGITYLEFDSEVQPTFEGEYGTSKVGGYTLEALLTARSK